MCSATRRRSCGSPSKRHLSKYSSVIDLLRSVNFPLTRQVAPAGHGACGGAATEPCLSPSPGPVMVMTDAAS